MQPRKLDILVAQFSYGGNGGFQSEHPDVGRYLAKLAVQLSNDDRIGRFSVEEFAETPITMARNRAVRVAKRDGFDCILMIDSDMKPDCEMGADPFAKPFFPTSFDFLYDHWERGPVVVGAPYSGPPPISNCYQFRWSNDVNADQSQNFNAKIEAYSRGESELMAGIQECAALPTGLILFDLRCFDLTDPIYTYKRLVDVEKLTHAEAKKRTRPWFYYEYEDIYEDRKASTEDVTATRDISYHGQLKLGYNPLFCNWDAWAGHHKPLCVRKPRSMKLEAVGENYKQAVLAGREEQDRLIHVDFTRNGNGRAVHA